MMLQAIDEAERKLGLNIGFKAAGGIATLEQAHAYINLAKNIMGDEWVTPQHCRIGTSRLLDEIINN